MACVGRGSLHTSNPKALIAVSHNLRVPSRARLGVSLPKNFSDQPIRGPRSTAERSLAPSATAELASVSKGLVPVVQTTRVTSYKMSAMLHLASHAIIDFVTLDATQSDMFNNLYTRGMFKSIPPFRKQVYTILSCRV